MKEVRDYTENEFGWFLSQELSKIDNIELLILKGHIFTEFALNCWLESISHKETADFFNNKYTYARKVDLAEIFGDNDELNEKIFVSIRILNKLRNSIAHNLKANEQLVPDFFASLKKIVSGQGGFNDTNLSKINRMAGGIAFLSGLIFSEFKRNTN